MKLFISSDIEGTCGITHWDETEAGKKDGLYQYFRQQMTAEAAAACQGAQAAGFDQVLVKDAHDTARNIMPDKLPQWVQLHRGWEGDLYSMMGGIEGGWDAVAFTGYHGAACDPGNALSHTMNTQLDEILINGQRTSEFMINSYTAGMLGIPVPFVSGDEALCNHAKSFIPGITAVATKSGRGNSATSPHPQVALDRIREGMEAALKGDWKSCVVPMPDTFEVSIRYTTHQKALSRHYYPGAALVNEKTISFSTDSYLEVLRFLHFVL